MNELDSVRLRLDQVTLTRPGFRSSPISFETGPGECVFVRGVNGAGKSTLLAAIAGLCPVAGGSIRYGRETWSAERELLEAWRRPCTILLQDLGLWPHLTIRQQCRLVADGNEAPLTAVADELGVTALLDRRPLELSGGEAQRCALARTLAVETPVVLLDEPFAAQHAGGIERVEAVIARLVAEGRVLVVAGHRAPPDARVVDLTPSASSR